MALLRVNPRLEAELTSLGVAHGPLARLLREVADEGAREAQRIARAEFYNKGGYLGGISGDSGFNEQGKLVGRIVGKDWKSHWGEFPPRQQSSRRGHILARAAKQIGLRVKPTDTGAANLALGRAGGGPARRGAGRGRVR